ncbi:MAG: NEAT domain-containing protein [Eubacterium sp.]|nr:NEAT domain-containing protein [Eubacterium sp.]
MKRIRKVLSFLLSIFVLLAGMSIQSFAQENTKQTAAGLIESGKVYLVPLDIYGLDGEPISAGTTGTIANFIDNAALVKKNDDGSYHVTLQLENYDKIDIFQVSKPGAIEDSVSPNKGSMGTFNIPETYIYSDKVDNVEHATTYLTGKTISRQTNTYFDESWNDKFIQNASVEEGLAGRTYYSFDTDNLTASMYVYGFYSYGRNREADTQYYAAARKQGKIWLKLGEGKEVKSIEASNYASAGLSFTKTAVNGVESGYADAWLDGKVSQLFGDAAASVSENGALTIAAQLKKDSNVVSVKELTSIKDLGPSTTIAIDKSFQAYMKLYPAEVNGNDGLAVYSDELVKDGAVSFTFQNDREAAFGKRVKIELADGTSYVTEMRVESYVKQSMTLTDENVTLTTDSYSVSPEAVFDAGFVKEDTDENSEYNLLYSKLAGNASKALMYNLSIKAGGENIAPKYPVELRFQIPDGWNKDKIEVYRLNGTYQEGAWNPLNLYEDNMSIKIEDNEVIISDTKSVNCALAIIETSSKADISEIQDGVYKVSVTMWQQDQPDRLSMSNSAVVSDSARLVVKDGKKHIYFDTQGITIAGKYGYTNGIFWANNEQTEEGGLPVLNAFTPLEYYSYYLNDSGSTDMDAYAEEYNLYYPKTVGFEFPESADRDDGVYLNFYVPIMDELQNKVPGSGEGSRTAFMTLSGLESVLEINEPTHDKSVLVVAIDKASQYAADDYTEASYEALANAVSKAQKVIDGTIFANDAEITALDKEIAEAIGGLKEATGLDKYNKVLNQAKALKEADYTAESWADLQAVINAQDGKVTEENADQASAELQSAAAALVPMSTAVSLEKGVYEVQAALTNLDGTANDLNAGLKAARLYTDRDGSITAYLYVDGIAGLQYRKGAGYEGAAADAGRLVFTLPANVENQKVKVTTENGEAELLLNLDLKAAVKQDVNASDLASKLEAAKALKAEDYTGDSFAAVTDAIAAAEGTLADKVAFQSEITAAETALDTATAGLVMKEEVKARTELDQAVSDAKNNYAEANYTKESYEKLQSAISEAEKVLEKTDATADEMKAQTDKLDKAVKALVRLEDAVDKTELNGYIKDALTKTNDGTYTDNSWNSFQAAIKAAQKVSADVGATKAEVEKQTKLLTASYEALVVKNRQSGLFEDYPQIFAGTYSVPITMLNATSDEDSMGNAAMVQTGIVRVTDKAEVTLEMSFHSLKFSGMTGYLYKLKKVDMDTVEYNQYNYPVKYQAADAAILEAYTDVYDLFNDKNSEYYDKNTEGNWYPKRVSIPVKLNDNLFYVEVYVPVMESIADGQGTKVARISIDWANIKQETGVERDNSVIEALLAQVSGMTQGDIPSEYWAALNAAYVTAQDVYNDMNASQKEIDLQIKALQAAVDAVETQKADKTELNALIEKAAAEADRTDVVYTSATLEALKTAIANAEAVAAKEDATKAEIQAQLTALQTALDGLRAVDKTKLNDLIAKAKAEVEKTDAYEDSSLTVLNTAITLAENIAANPKATESEVAAAERALTTALEGLVEKEAADKSALEGKLAEAKAYLSQTDLYTESSLAALQEAVDGAQKVMDNASASQKLVDDQVTKLTEAIQQLAKKSEENPDTNKGDNNTNTNAGGNNNNNATLGNGSLGGNALGSGSLGSSALGNTADASVKSASNAKTGVVVQEDTLWAAMLLLGGAALLTGSTVYNRKKK